MRARLPLIATTLAVLGTLLVGVTAGSAKTKAHKATHKCTVVATSQTPNQTTGYDFGVEKCSAPYGAGLAYIAYKEAVAGTQVTDTGAFKSYYNRGTNHGVFKLVATVTPGATTITAAGTIKILGGTGAFVGTKAQGKMVCTTNDGGSHYTCVAKF